MYYDEEQKQHASIAIFLIFAETHTCDGYELLYFTIKTLSSRYQYRISENLWLSRLHYKLAI